MDYEKAVQEMNNAVNVYDSLLMKHSVLLLQLEEAEHHLQQTRLRLEYGHATVAEVKQAMERCVNAEHEFGVVMQEAITTMTTARHNMYVAYKSKN